MAFRLPAQAPASARRQAPPTTERPPSLDIESLSTTQQIQDDDAKEWVLFSPSQADDARTRSDSTERTARTTGLSRLSDFGSFNAATTHVDTDEQSSAADILDEAESVDEDEEEEEDDGGATELDSLDDRLHDFRQSNLLDNSNPVLPTHDGLGSFHASGQLAQEHLWQFEQYNPRRQQTQTHTRRLSVQQHLETVDEQESAADRERWQRIEKWRTDQGRILLQELERESRRRQRRNSLAATASRMSGSEVLGSISETNPIDASQLSSSTETESSPDDSPEESFWRRVTRKVIRDLIGINDSILSVILGESMVEDTDSEPKHLDSRANAHGIEDAIRDVPITASSEDSIWQEKLIQRITRELGILVHQMWEYPGAFSTYLRVENPADFYAGIPIRQSESTPRSRTPRQTETEESNAWSTMSPHFTPTLRDPATIEHAAHWGIEEDEVHGNAHSQSTGVREHQPLSESAHLKEDREYWERDLDIAMIFRYLKNRFRRSDAQNTTSSSTATHREQDASSRAAVIRQHHPLVARAHAQRSQARQSALRAQLHAANMQTSSSPISRHRFRRPSSSCASQSTRVSAKRLGSGSSRHYWDIGGSVGSGSAVVSVGGVGTWGDA